MNKINEALLLDPEPEIKLNFSKREIELLKLLETDLTYKEIGEKLHISFSTVKWHINNIYGKLEVKNRTGAVVAARDNALI